MANIALTIDSRDGIIRFEQSSVLLGRSANCDISFDSTLVSREHAELQVSADGRWMIRDLGSANHTLLNGNKIDCVELATGDVVQLGKGGPGLRVLTFDVAPSASRPVASGSRTQPLPIVEVAARPWRWPLWVGLAVVLFAGLGGLVWHFGGSPSAPEERLEQSRSIEDRSAVGVRDAGTRDLHQESLSLADVADVSMMMPRSVARVDDWVVYMRLRGETSELPTRSPIVEQSPLIIAGDALICAGRLRAGAGVLWVVEFDEPVDDVSLTTEQGEGLPLVAAGLDLDACVLLASAAARDRAAAGPIRCAVFRAPRNAAVRLGDTALVPRTAEIELPGEGEIVEIDAPTALATLKAEAGGLVRRTELPGDLPTRIAVLRTARVMQSIVTHEVAGSELPLMIAWDGHTQVAGWVEVRAAFETDVRIEDVDASFECIVDLAAGRVLPALVGRDLVHVAPGATR